MKLRYRESVEEYLEELNPKYYNRLEQAGELESYLNKMTGWAMGQHSQIRTKEMTKRMNSKDWKGGWKAIQELEEVNMIAEELVREMLEQQVRAIE